ncbi:MAG: hypothetical protein ACLFTT_12630 [Candidatus Hydrogenedentota bacterium]
MVDEQSQRSNWAAARTECVGTCMVCDPHCGVHQVRRDREQERLARAEGYIAAFAGTDLRRGHAHSGRL